ncbi:hypothetical protein BUALT_Bualt01G0152600 [Buddleja alternifolia]|uniref:Protein kinase domain-containing protein n=1 Tax=Buddleja alternifolia TaxID=168488 RepID=A0AAV6YEA6_9LAMI|nr:hypothetical protein BUALT_Bualt01G0152600 [Buddleja alternifolia]
MAIAYCNNNDHLSQHVERNMVISGLESMYRYEYINTIGSGSYGNVYKALDKQTGEIVAMKQEIHGLSKSSFREIKILQSLPRHPSMVELKDVIITDGREQVYIVMEYLETDLKRYINNLKKEKSLGISEVKSLMKQLLEGVKFLHENGVMHRDLKPSNLLMNIRGDQLKICDFGLSREFGSKSGSYTPGVGTRWYRAPELLIHGANKYSSAVDMWSVGCIMAELVLKEVLFKGGSEIDQLSKIHKILGAPNHDVASSSSQLNLLRQMILGDTSCRRAPGLLTELGFDLLSKLLAYDPNKRITAEDALRHGWFVEFDSYSCSEFDSILDYYRLVLYQL